nr:unknown [Zea mays]
MRPPLGGLISIVGDKFRQKPVPQPQPLRRHAGLHHQHHYQQQQRI